jgi:recombinational DNA repair ATPase RecF
MKRKSLNPVADDEWDESMQSALEDNMEENVKRVKRLPSTDIGTIEYLELVNFMCHKFLKIKLGPKINFVIGRNGSGKSAILTALTVCLGAKAHFTNRAGNLRSLIKSGEMYFGFV